MVVHNQGQALCVAVEMERRAIRVYERALAMSPAADVADGIRSILSDEREHLKRFSAMQAEYPVAADEEKLLISGMAAEVLFTGGVMAMHREHALTTLRGLYQYAAESEANAVETYGGFAQRCRDERVREAFMAIVHEESQHLTELTEKLRTMDE